MQKSKKFKKKQVSQACGRKLPKTLDKCGYLGHKLCVTSIQKKVRRTGRDRIATRSDHRVSTYKKIPFFNSQQLFWKTISFNKWRDKTSQPLPKIPQLKNYFWKGRSTCSMGNCCQQHYTQYQLNHILFNTSSASQKQSIQ